MNVKSIDKPLILIVDDVPNNLKVLARMLEKEGYEITIATTGQKALSIIENVTPDLILLDVMMPEMDGYETCKIIKSKERFANVPIIFLTVRSDVKDIVKGFELGASDYLTKPFNLQELIIRVKTHLKLKITQDENKKYIEQLKQTNEKLTKTQEELYKTNKSKDKFFSIIAHDLKNPFQTLLGMSEMMYENFEEFSTDQLKELSTDMHQSAENLYKLLENLLAWSRIQMGRLDFKPREMKINDVIEENVDLYEKQLEIKKIALNMNYDKNLSIFADRNMLKTVVRNLLSNAIKFTHENGSISINATESDAMVALSIEDTGIGMSKEQVDSVFSLDINSSRPGTNDEEGTGLGLILCKELIVNNGGNIEIKSKLNEGTKITINLPQKI